MLRTLLLLAVVAVVVAGLLVVVRGARGALGRATGPDPQVLEAPRALPGWYPDPEGTPRLRWWDGLEWTDDYRAGPPS
ncbi:MAG: DUF2510 domain-containing protein [Candidatus Nanopelagicales bacterium]